MLAVEDARDGLKWAESIGGLKALIQRSEKNLKTVADWAASSGWADFLAERPETRSCTSICLKIVDPWFRSLDAEAQAAAAKRIAALLEQERSEERRGGKGCVSTCRSRWSPYH